MSYEHYRKIFLFIAHNPLQSFGILTGTILFIIVALFYNNAVSHYMYPDH